MRLSTITNFGASLMSLATSAAAFDAAGSNNVVLYWGQASAGSQEPLGTYCESNAADVYVVSFLNSFNGNGDLTLTISGCNDNFAGGLANCPAIAADIKKCQSLGKKVFISLGGAVGSYGFTSDAGGANFADTLWNTFGGGTAAERPFGDAIVDGYDLDIENQQQMGYVALVKRLREHFASSSGKYYISATPQCPYPDASVGEALAGADIDFAYVQFYNNYCGVNNPGQFNFDTWDNFAKTVSPNKNIKIYLGVPAAVSAASTGYIDGATLKSYVDKVKQYSSFGGIMMWDASQAFINKEGGVTYAEIAKNALGGAGPAPAPVVSVASTPAAVSSAAWAPASSPVAPVASSSPAWVAPGPVSSSAVWVAPSSANNGQWKPEVSSVGSLAAPSAPIFAAQSGDVESDSTVTEEHTVTSVGETVTTTVPREGEAAAPITSSIPAPVESSAAGPVESSAAASAPAESPASVPAPSSSKAKHTVYATTIESVYIDTTVVNVPGPSPTAEISSVHSLAAPSGPAFAAESGEVKVKNETAPESEPVASSSSVELTTTTTSSVFTTHTVTGTTVVVTSSTAVASSEAVAEAKPESSAAASSAASSAAESSAVVTAEGAAATSSAATLTSLSTVAPSDLLKTATATSVTISLADSAPQKTISPESAHPPCDGKQGNDLAKCLNGIYGNQEVISKLSVQDKQKPVQTDAPAAASSTEAPAAASTTAAASSAEAPVASSAAASSTEAAAAKPTESAESKPDSDPKPSTESKDTSSKDTSSKDTPSTSAPLADSGCTEGEVGCSPSGEFIMCNFNKWVHFACPPTTTCFAVASGKNAVVGCNFIDAPIPLLKRDESLPRPPPTLQQRRQNNVDVFAMLK